MRPMSAPIAPAPSSGGLRPGGGGRAWAIAEGAPRPMRGRLAHAGTSAGGQVDHPVRQRGQRGPVGHDQRRPAADQPADRGEHVGLGLAVETGGRLVEQEEGRVAHEGPGQRDALALAGRQAGAALAERRVGAHRGGGHDVGRARPRRGPPPPRRRRHRAGRGGRCRRSSAAKRCGRWGTQAIVRRQASGSRSARSTPPSVTVPASGEPRPRSTASRVDFPQPLGPVERHDLARARRPVWRRAGPGACGRGR